MTVNERSWHYRLWWFFNETDKTPPPQPSVCGYVAFVATLPLTIPAFAFMFALLAPLFWLADKAGLHAPVCPFGTVKVERKEEARQ